MNLNDTIDKRIDSRQKFLKGVDLLEEIIQSKGYEGCREFARIKCTDDDDLKRVLSVIDMIEKIRG